MKQKDVALIVVIGIISAVLSVLVSSRIFVSNSKRQIKAPVVDAINTQFTQPNSKYFNANSVDPAQEVQIGNSSNQNPFNGSSQ